MRSKDGTREAILAAAQTMMAEHGPQGVTVSDVARRAGVNRGTAYQHFPSRGELLSAVIDRLGRNTKAVLDAAAPESLNQRIDETVEYFVGHPELVRLSIFRLLAGMPHPTGELWEDYVARVRHLADRRDSVSGVDSEMLAVILLGATLFWSLRVQGGAARASDTRRYLRELKRLMLYGVVEPEQHRDLVAATDGLTSRTSVPRPKGAVSPLTRARPKHSTAPSGRGTDGSATNATARRVRYRRSQP